MLRALCLLLALRASSAAESSYKELFDEDNAGLTTLEKNARTFLRYVEHRNGRKITEQEMRKGYADRIALFRTLEDETGINQIPAIREWVKAVAPAMTDVEGHHVGGIRYDTHGPLHLVMEKASEFLGREHDPDEHPYRAAKEIVAGIRKFTEAIVKYFRHRERGFDRDEL